MRTVSCLRPFLRRRANVALPHFVSIRARNPCVLNRRVLRGRYVGFPIGTLLLRRHRAIHVQQQIAKPSQPLDISQSASTIYVLCARVPRLLRSGGRATRRGGWFAFSTWRRYLRLPACPVFPHALENACSRQLKSGRESWIGLGTNCRNKRLKHGSSRRKPSRWTKKPLLSDRQISLQRTGMSPSMRRCSLSSRRSPSVIRSTTFSEFRSTGSRALRWIFLCLRRPRSENKGSSNVSASMHTSLHASPSTSTLSR